MAHLYKPAQVETQYARKNWAGTAEEYQHTLDTTSTVYVGNLSFFTREEQIWELFSKVGEVKRIVMGLNKYELTPCGFCFVEYYTHEAAADCVSYVSGTKLDERVIRADWDTGFVEGRQFGRGSTGGQIRDEFRDYYDPERGDRRPKPSPSHDHHSSHGSSHSSQRSSGHSSSSTVQHHSPHNFPHASPSDHRHPSEHGSRSYSPSHDRHSRDYDSSDHRREREDRTGGRRDRNDDYHHRDRRDDHHDYRRDYHDSPSYSRPKRPRDDYEQRHPAEPMVDEFGRDIPMAKRSKTSETPNRS